MTPNKIYYLVLFVIILNFLINKFLDFLNASHYNKPIPNKLKDIYEESEYMKSRRYEHKNFKFSLVSSSISFIATLAFIILKGPLALNTLVGGITTNVIFQSLFFFGIIGFLSLLINLPFAYYYTFVIEEKFGFNKTTLKMFFLDKLKSLLISCVVGGLILYAVIYLYTIFNENFWIYAWITIAGFMLFMNMFYAKLIVPLFNKQTPLEEGDLKTQIFNYCKKVNFSLSNVFVIDGSKRSTKANAYFSGLGKTKQITLYDTLIKDLTEKEIVAVLAHEVGHYKKKHILYNLFISVFFLSVFFYLMSLFLNYKVVSQAFDVSNHSFHIGVFVFTLLYFPFEFIKSIILNYISRLFEYQADRYAKETYGKADLINALKKLSKKNLSNLTPHPRYVEVYYSHPTLLQRIISLEDGFTN